MGVTKGGAAKLHDSAVAPLVAAARGYRTVEPDDLKGLLDEYLLGATNGRAGRSIEETLGFDRGMLMPWYSFSDIEMASRQGRTAKSHTVQLKPEPPVMDDTERPKKYIIGLGQKIPSKYTQSFPSNGFTTPRHPIRGWNE